MIASLDKRQIIGRYQILNSKNVKIDINIYFNFTIITV